MTLNNNQKLDKREASSTQMLSLGECVHTIYCHERTSSALVPEFLSGAGLGSLCDWPSFPNDHAITPALIVETRR